MKRIILGLKTISDYMLQQNEEFHIVRKDYGSFGYKWAKGVTALVKLYNINSIIDFGAGKKTLEKSIDMDIQSYDPAFDGPEPNLTPADLLVCTHVLEHVEPEFLSSTLEYLNTLTKKVFLIAVDNGVSGKILPDGMESNLIQKDMTWWQAQLETAFNTSVINIDRQLFIKKGQIKQITSQDKGTFIGCRNQ
jgi:hypothetical protein